MASQTSHERRYSRECVRWRVPTATNGTKCPETHTVVGFAASKPRWRYDSLAARRRALVKKRYAKPEEEERNTATACVEFSVLVSRMEQARQRLKQMRRKIGERANRKGSMFCTTDAPAVAPRKLSPKHKSSKESKKAGSGSVLWLRHAQAFI